MFPLDKNSMVAMARDYWKTCLPARYQFLLEAGQLEQALTAAAEMTLEAMQSLRNAGFSQWEAWEATRENHLLLPKEPASGVGCEGAQCPKDSKSLPVANRNHSPSQVTATRSALEVRRPPTG